MPRNKVPPYLTDAVIRLLAEQAATSPHTLPAGKPKRVRKPVPLVKDSLTVTATSVDLVVGVRLVSRANLDSHGHWTKRHKANQELDATLGVMLATVDEAVRERLAKGCVVKLSRIAPRRLDKDNLHAALKHARDLIAQSLLGGRAGQRDEAPAIDWREPGQASDGGRYGLEVKIWEASR